jgi:predicted HTH domain antitoxin
MYYIVFSIIGINMTEKSAVVTVRLSKRDLERVEALRVLEDVDRSTLIKEFIEDGLRRRVVDLYQRGKLTAGRATEILGISLREFLEILEKEGVSVNWNSESIREYLKAKYGD